MKVVLDTNVLIDAFKDEYSYEKRIINEVIAGQIEAYANRQTLQENKLLLNQVIGNDQYRQELNDFFGQVNNVYTRRDIHVVRDEEDNKILASALEAGAEYLVTRDNDLLSLEEYEGVKVVNPTEFWAHYHDDEGQDLWKQWAGFMAKK
jgi:putative PIN family toxin of toxin-antitoxin system